MTFKEKLQLEHPREVDSRFQGGCMGCPIHYNYEDSKPCLKRPITCKKCWNRKIPETNSTENKGEESMKHQIYQNFTKKDLKVGYVVKVHDGRFFMVMQTTNKMVLVTEDEWWLDLARVNDDLSNPNKPEYNIDEVYGYSEFGYCSRTISTTGRTLLWKRGDPAKKMTVEEIERELGYKVEIVS